MNTTTTKVQKGHKVDVEMIATFRKTVRLAGSTYDANGKLLLMEIGFEDKTHRPIVNFEVWSNTNTMLDNAPVEISTRILERAIEKYNTL